MLIRNPALWQWLTHPVTAGFSVTSGRPDNALPIQRRSDSPRAADVVLSARTRRYR